MLNPMARSTNTGGASSSSSENAGQHLYQRTRETDQILPSEGYELGLRSPNETSEAQAVISVSNEGLTSSNTEQEQEKKDSNKISLEEELHQELWKSFSNFRLFEFRINTPSGFKKKILAKERNQTQTQLQHIHERFREAFVKLSELSTANQSAESTINLKARGKASSEEELEEESEPQPTAESSTYLKGKGKVPSEEEWKIVEQKINSQQELEKKLKKELEELKQQLIGLKNANRNVLKFLTVIDADLKRKVLYDFSRLRLGFKWVTRLLPLANIPSTVINILRRSPVIGLWIGLGTNLITWWINDVFNPIVGNLNQYQTNDLKSLKEEVFPAILLCIVDQRIRDFEQGISNFKQRLSKLEKRIEEMNSQIILKTQRELIQTQRDLFNAQQDLIQKQQEIADLEAKHKQEISKLNVKIDDMGKDMKKILEAINNRG